jgi:hypothetical protein
VARVKIQVVAPPVHQAGSFIIAVISAGSTASVAITSATAPVA